MALSDAFDPALNQSIKMQSLSSLQFPAYAVDCQSSLIAAIDTELVLTIPLTPGLK